MPGQHPDFKITLVNLGKYPAIIDSVYYWAGISSSLEDIKKVKMYSSYGAYTVNKILNANNDSLVLHDSTFNSIKDSSRMS
jgi:hypothetical protein